MCLKLTRFCLLTSVNPSLSPVISLIFTSYFFPRRRSLGSPRDDKGLDDYDSIFTLSCYTIEILQSALTLQNLSYYERGNSKNGTKSDCVAV